MNRPTARPEERSRPLGGRVVILGRPGAGKSTLADELGWATGLPVVHLDEHYWTGELRPPSEEEWLEREKKIIAGEEWIVEGHLGRADDVGRRVARAETVVVLDLPAWLCALRAIRRGRERRDFWLWLLAWRRRGLPPIRRAVEESGEAPAMWTFRSGAEVRALVDRVRRGASAVGRTRATDAPRADGEGVGPVVVVRKGVVHRGRLAPKVLNAKALAPGTSPAKRSTRTR